MRLMVSTTEDLEELGPSELWILEEPVTAEGPE